MKETSYPKFLIPAETRRFAINNVIALLVKQENEKIFLIKKSGGDIISVQIDVYESFWKEGFVEIPLSEAVLKWNWVSEVI